MAICPSGSSRPVSVRSRSSSHGSGAANQRQVFSRQHYRHHKDAYFRTTVETFVAGEVVGPFLGIPSQVVFPAVRCGQTYTASVSIKGSRGQLVDVDRVVLSTTPKELTAAFDRAGAQPKLILTLNLSSPSKAIIRGMAVGRMGDRELFRIGMLGVPDHQSLGDAQSVP